VCRGLSPPSECPAGRTKKKARPQARFLNIPNQSS
jgi:hypothetical protein